MKEKRENGNFWGNEAAERDDKSDVDDGDAKDASTAAAKRRDNLLRRHFLRRGLRRLLPSFMSVWRRPHGRHVPKRVSARCHSHHAQSHDQDPGAAREQVNGCSIVHHLLVFQ